MEQQRNAEFEFFRTTLKKLAVTIEGLRFQGALKQGSLSYSPMQEKYND